VLVRYGLHTGPSGKVVHGLLRAEIVPLLFQGDDSSKEVVKTSAGSSGLPPHSSKGLDFSARAAS
jgi:hypothetical protein